jgi:hypothetical protein
VVEVVELLAQHGDDVAGNVLEDLGVIEAAGLAGHG